MKKAAVRAARKAEESPGIPLTGFGPFLLEPRAPSTIKDDRIHYSLHIVPVLGKKSIPELTVHGIDKSCSRLEKAGKSPQTVRLYRR